MKVKLNFKQIVDIVNLDRTTTGILYEDAVGKYPEEVIIDAEIIPQMTFQEHINTE